MASSSYNALVEAASRLAGIELYVDVDRNCIDFATALLERIRPVLDSTRTTEFHRCEVPVEFNPDFFSHHMDDVQYLRNLSSAFRFASDVAAFNGDYEAVAQYGITILDLANAVRRGGLVVDHLVAIAISGCGVGCLRTARDRFVDSVRRDLIDALDRNEREREPYSEIAERDARWEAESGFEDDGSELSEDEFIDSNSELAVEDQKAMIQLMKVMAGAPEAEMEAMYANQERHALAISRLLSVDLAIRCWKDRNGRYPNSIADLAPPIFFPSFHSIHSRKTTSFIALRLTRSRFIVPGRTKWTAAVVSLRGLRCTLAGTI